MSASELKFLVDVGVGKKVEEYLLEKGYDTKAVRSLDQSMPDQEIIRLAALEKRIVITMDKDFGESATTSRAGGMRMAPGRGRGHLCWGPLIFKKNFLIPVLSDLLVLMTT